MEVYVATNIITGKKYVGISTRSMKWRREKHKCDYKNPKYNGTKFYQAIQQYGWESFVWEVVATAKTQEELWRKERNFIFALNSFEDGYNSTTGGAGKQVYDKPLPPKQAAKSLLDAMRKIEERRRC